MAIKTQGTELYLRNPSNDAVVTVGCVLSISGIDSPVEQIETTCLSDLDRTYIAGLKSPGAATFELNMDPTDASHELLHQLKEAGTSTDWAVGWSNATTDPTVDSSSDWVLPTDRHWLTFDGFMTGFSFDFSQNETVKSSISIQISGAITLTKATT